MEHFESFKRVEEVLPSFDGVSLNIGQYVRIHPKAHVILIPQFGCCNHEYVDKYEALWDAGYAMYALDLRGHGGSSGTPLLVKRMEDLLDDIDILLARIKDRSPGEPVYLVGDGIGAWLVLACSLRQGANVAGIVLHQFVPMPEISPLEMTYRAFRAWMTPQTSGELVAPLGGVLPQNPALAIPSRSIYELLRLCDMIRNNIIELISPSLVLTRETDLLPAERLLAEGALSDVTYAASLEDSADAARIVVWMDARYKYAVTLADEDDDD